MWSTAVSMQSSGYEAGAGLDSPAVHLLADLSSLELRWHQPPPTATGRHSLTRSRVGRASVNLAPVLVAATRARPPGFSGDLCPPSSGSVHSSM